MGHGNYLISRGVDVPPEVAASHTHYRGGAVERGHWEIQFAKAYRSPETLPTFKGYSSATDSAAPAAGESVKVGDATMTENPAKGGIEIRFPSKPDGTVLATLKAHGWRWSRFGACWYHRADEASRTWAKAFLGHGEATAEQPGPDRFDMQVEDNMAAACGA
jgi:hypothetical protein